MTKETGGSAFPHERGLFNCGMTLRDYFAAKAMQAMVASPSYYIDGWAQSDIAIQSYQMADAMLEARK
jgi:hypothetical protein